MEFLTGYGEARRYKIQEIIGKGSFGVVAAAVDTQTGELVAIKKIKDVFEHASNGTRILREIKLLWLLRHPNIVEIKHIMLPPARREFRDVYIIFELMESDLHQVIQANPNLAASYHRFFLYQLLHALKYIHAANVCHRDLKPSNILANSDCKLKVCDFGLARTLRDDDASTIFWTDHVATRWYRAPELCGLFVSKIRNEKARRHLTNMQRKLPIPLSLKFRDADPQAICLLECLLAFDPKDRPTAEEALADPYFRELPKLEHEPSTHPFSKGEFEFERWKVTKDDVRHLIYREILEYHPQMLQEYMRGEQASFVYPSRVDSFRLQFAHLENYPRGERSAPLWRRHASLPRERVCTPEGKGKDKDTQDCNNEKKRKTRTSSAARTIISRPRPQQEGPAHAYAYQNGTDIPDFCSGYYLQNGSTSAYNCVMEGNEGPKENGVCEEERLLYEFSE